MTSVRTSAGVATAPQESLKFPELSDDILHLRNEHALSDELASPAPGDFPNFDNLWSGRADGERWQVRRGGGLRPQTYGHHVGRHGRQKSISEALQTVRDRKGSVSQSAQDIAQALKAPVSIKLVLLCGCWYATSILANASSKAILTAFPKPMTLTVVQFLFVCSWCIFSAALARAFAPVRQALPILRHGIRPPSKAIFVYTLPLTAFQIGGHILNSDAMSRIPVSLVHTIKGLSPLFTVLAYRLFFSVRYSVPTYLSLVPLTLGVILACSASLQAEFVGILYAFGSALAFVTQNIVSKKLFNEAARAEADHAPYSQQKPDKLNLLCYSTGLALLFTLPLWLWSEGLGLMADLLADASVELSQRPGSLDHGRLIMEYIFNGSFHFLQSLVAFALLGMVSPVTYSVASLIKRVFVIVFAIIWFGNRMTGVQGFGIALTIFGLYLYDRTSDAARVDKRLAAKEDAERHLLPLASVTGSATTQGHVMAVDKDRRPSAIRVSFDRDILTQDDKRDDGPQSGLTPEGVDPHSRWLPPGTKQEQTWTLNDVLNDKTTQGEHIST